MWRHAEIRTLADVPRYWARTTPDAIALVDPDRTVTYAELDARSDRIAAAIVAAGIAPGAHIGYLATNSAEFFEVWFGAVKAGCALAPFNWRCTEAELTELVDDAQTPLLIAGPQFGVVAAAVRGRAAAPLEVVASGAGLDAWCDQHTGAVPSARIHPEDIALLAYTSGTTGRPKGAQLSHRAFQYWFLISSLEEAETWSGDDVALGVMPNFHLAGSWVPLPALYHGAQIAIVPAFDPDAVLAAIDRHRPTVTCLVPTAIGLLLDHPATAGHDFSSLRRWLYAGSTISAETLRRAIATFGCDMVQFYGTSETYIITLLRPAQHDPDDVTALVSCGEPVPLVDIRIVDAAGADVAGGEIGEVLVRSPTMFNGYWNLPDITAAALVEGWYHTGDLGRRDDSGRLHLVDRLKDMIVTGGENVYSVEVERALAAHPAVAGVGVVGVPDQRWGERIVAAVIPRPGHPVTTEELIAHCQQRIARYKAPKEIRFVDALPMTSSGKVRKATLREQLAPAHA